MIAGAGDAGVGDGRHPTLVIRGQHEWRDSGMQVHAERGLPSGQRALTCRSDSIGILAGQPHGGLGKQLFSDPYNAFANNLGSAGTNYLPWLVGGAGLNAQQPFWTYDGVTGQNYGGRAGWINNGPRRTDGTLFTTSDGLAGRRFPTPFLGIGTLNSVAQALNLPQANYGQYRAQSMTDPGIFDFYNTLIDGPNKWEREKWDAYNVELTQTAFKDRLGAQLSR